MTMSTPTVSFARTCSKGNQHSISQICTDRCIQGKSYQRLTAPLLTDWTSLRLTDILYTTCFHFFETPADLERQVEAILDIRMRHRAEFKKPLIIWEPQAKMCNPETLQAHLKAVRLVDIFSPNHAELASLFEDKPSRFHAGSARSQAERFKESGIGHENQGCVVVRAAEHGCLVVSRGNNATWLPAFHHSDSDRVIDPTGAGNAFLGGFAIGYLETMCYTQAAHYGQVAASFVVEQIGLPIRSHEGSTELWNGQSVKKRLEIYREMVRPVPEEAGFAVS